MKKSDAGKLLSLLILLSFGCGKSEPKTVPVEDAGCVVDTLEGGIPVYDIPCQLGDTT